MSRASQYDIFLDGSCSFCRWTREKIEPYDSDARLRFLDYNDPLVAAQAPLSRTELRSEMNLRTPEGLWLRGFAAWVAILRVLPRLAWVGWLATLPPMRWIGPSLYKFIARRRHAIPGAPVRCTSDVCAVPKPHRR